MPSTGKPPRVAMTNAERQARYIANLKREAAERDPTAALAEASAYIEWQMNPCGKPALKLGRPLHRFKERQVDRLHILGVDTDRQPMGKNRAPMLSNLQGAYHMRREFPGTLAGYFEGPAHGAWVIEIYGEGDAWPVKPEPPRPSFMDAPPTTGTEVMARARG